MEEEEDIVYYLLTMDGLSDIITNLLGTSCPRMGPVIDIFSFSDVPMELPNSSFRNNMTTLSTKHQRVALMGGSPGDTKQTDSK